VFAVASIAGEQPEGNSNLITELRPDLDRDIQPGVAIVSDDPRVKPAATGLEANGISILHGKVS
jgi:hypothetical protein